MRILVVCGALFFATIFLESALGQAAQPSAQQLANWLKRFPAADTNGDGQLTLEEAKAYREKVQGSRKSRSGGAPREFAVDPGWEKDRFPEQAISHLPADEIKAVYEKMNGGKQPAVRSFEKPTDGAPRVVGTGHSFMAPGYRTLPPIVEAAGFGGQPLYTHTGGGITGSTRYKWEQENGIFQFDGKPVPKLLASISNAEWEAMMWGPYFNDKPEYYTCWIDFCLKYQPGMKFYLSDAWPQLHQLDAIPTSEGFFTEAVFDQLAEEKRAIYGSLVRTLRESSCPRVYILPTSDAMTLAAQAYLRGELPGIEGINKAIGKKERSLWGDQLGHLGPGFDRLEGYVFYATLYGKSPELIEGDINFGNKNATFPSPELDRRFREIAWQAVIGNPFSGVVDADGDGIGDAWHRAPQK